MVWRVGFDEWGDASAYDFAGDAAPSGTVTFASGQTTASITVAVKGDNEVELDHENFTVILESATNALIAAGLAGGTILEDDDDVPNTTASAPLLGTGTSAIGLLHNTGDVDVYRVVLKGGVSYVFAMQGGEEGYPNLDPRLELLGTNGTTVLATSGNGGGGLDARLGFTPVADGTYYLRGSTQNGTQGSYVLSSRVYGTDDLPGRDGYLRLKMDHQFVPVDRSLNVCSRAGRARCRDGRFA